MLLANEGRPALEEASKEDLEKGDEFNNKGVMIVEEEEDETQVALK